MIALDQRPTRTALRFYGGKSAVAPLIATYLPPHTTYVEPFAGGASVLLHKAPAQRETINDLDHAVYSFWKTLRERPASLITAIERTPFSREEMERTDLDAPGLSHLERARRLYIRSWQSIHGAPSRGRMGWRCDTQATGNGTNVDAWCRTDHLWQIAGRLRHVQVEHRPALEVIRRYDRPGCLHYIDPPYVAGTRGKRWATAAYAHEMTDADHVALADALHRVAGLVVLSGYASALYSDLYADWRLVTFPARTQSRDTAQECLWLSPAAQDAYGSGAPLLALAS